MPFDEQLHLGELVVAILQLIATVAGGYWAIILFKQANRESNQANQEKRQSFVLMLYDRLYNDVEISHLLRVLDKGKPEDAIEIASNGKLEPNADKSLRFLGYIYNLIQNRSLERNDISAFDYEINLLIGAEGEYREIVLSYRRHLETHGISSNLDALSSKPDFVN